MGKINVLFVSIVSVLVCEKSVSAIPISTDLSASITGYPTLSELYISGSSPWGSSYQSYGTQQSSNGFGALTGTSGTLNPLSSSSQGYANQRSSINFGTGERNYGSLNAGFDTRQTRNNLGANQENEQSSNLNNQRYERQQSGNNFGAAQGNTQMQENQVWDSSVGGRSEVRGGMNGGRRPGRGGPGGDGQILSDFASLLKEFRSVLDEFKIIIRVSASAGSEYLNMNQDTLSQNSEQLLIDTQNTAQRLYDDTFGNLPQQISGNLETSASIDLGLNQVQSEGVQIA